MKAEESGVMCSSLISARGILPRFTRRGRIRFMFHARQTELDSPRAPFIPRSRNCRNFMTCLIKPNTGSTVHLRNAYNLRRVGFAGDGAWPPTASAYLAVAPARRSDRTARHDGLAAERDQGLDLGLRQA